MNGKILFIKQSAEILPSYDIRNEKEVCKFLEMVGRTCYQSEPKGEPEKFVKMLVNRKHEGILEHVNFIFEVSPEVYRVTKSDVAQMSEEYGIQPYFKFTHLPNRYIISGNVRAFREYFHGCEILELMTAFEFLLHLYPILFGEFTSLHRGLDKTNEIRLITNDELITGDYYWAEINTHCCISAKFITNRGVTHEIVRHRVASYAQESTRYCNYNDTMTFILPVWFKHFTGGVFCPTEVNESGGINRYALTATDGITRIGDNLDASVDEYLWMCSCIDAKEKYEDLIKLNWTPEQAREVLPNSLKTTLIMTAPVAEWKHFLNLRAFGLTGRPHPQIKDLATQLLHNLKDKYAVFKYLGEPKNDY